MSAPVTVAWKGKTYTVDRVLTVTTAQIQKIAAQAVKKPAGAQRDFITGKITQLQGQIVRAGGKTIPAQSLRSKINNELRRLELAQEMATTLPYQQRPHTLLKHD